MTDRPERDTADAADDPLPNIGNPARSALELAGITRMGQLPQQRAAELLTLHGVGPKAIRLLREALAARGQRFADD